MFGAAYLGRDTHAGSGRAYSGAAESSRAETVGFYKSVDVQSAFCSAWIMGQWRFVGGKIGGLMLAS